jgi:hypothetical protein
MRKARPVIIAFMIYKNLRFVFEAPESSAVHYAIAVSLITRPVGVLFFGINAAPAVLTFKGIRCQIFL